MLSRAYTKSRRQQQQYGDQTKSGSFYEYEDMIVGFDDDRPLISCTNTRVGLTMKEVLRSSVGVMGESFLGLSEKVVLSSGEMFGVKRFKKVRVRRSEFGRRVERLADVSRKCEYLVPINAYLYTKRIKFVLCDYYPMGSLADVLSGGRKLGHTALNWNQRLKIIFHIARAIRFIHKESTPPKDRSNMQMNIHGNIKSSNVMLAVDFSARLSDYGFAQLATTVEIPLANSSKSQLTLLEDNYSLYRKELDQKNDIYNFGVIILDLLGGSRVTTEFRKCILGKRGDIREGKLEFFEFDVEGREKKRALQILDIALDCTKRMAESRPTIDRILFRLGDIVGSSSNNKDCFEN